MTRFRLTVSTEYEVNSEHYGTEDVAEMLAIDQANAEDDALGLLLVGDTSLKVVVEDVTTYNTTYDRGGLLPKGITNVVITTNDFRVDL